MALQISFLGNPTVAGRHLGHHHQLTEPVSPVQSSPIVGRNGPGAQEVRKSRALFVTGHREAES